MSTPARPECRRLAGESSNTTSATAPSISTVDPNTVLPAHYTARSNLTSTAPTGMTERYDQVGSATAQFLWFSNDHAVQSPTGSNREPHGHVEPVIDDLRPSDPAAPGP